MVSSAGCSSVRFYTALNPAKALTTAAVMALALFYL
jgi:hypothetical protein